MEEYIVLVGVNGGVHSAGGVLMEGYIVLVGCC